MDIEQSSGASADAPAHTPKSLYRSNAISSRRFRLLGANWAPRLLLLLILLVGAYFRSLSLTDWDAGTGQHPDERFFTDVASNVRLPASLGEWYDSARSPLNPRTYQQYPLYVYGPLPIYLTRAVAVALTPREALPEQVPSILGPVQRDPSTGENRTNFGPLIANPERSFPRLAPLIPLVNPEGRNLTAYGEIVKVGRTLAALFDLGAIVLIALIGRRLFGTRVGLLAAAFSAFTVMQIQQSHFFVDPIFSTFFCLLALYWAVRAAQGGSWPIYIALGASIGTAMATRITLATLGLTAMVAAGIAAWRAVQKAGGRRQAAGDRRQETGDRSRETEAGQAKARHWQQEELFQQKVDATPSVLSIWSRVIDRFISREFLLLCLAGAMTLLSFRALAPDAFTGSVADSPVMIGERPLNTDLLQGWGFFDVRPDPRFIQNLTTVRSLVTGEYDFPPSQQWVGREAYSFPWRNMLWGMGPALALAAWIGWALWGLGGVRRFFDRKTRWEAKSLHPAWVLFIWAGFYFAWQGAQFAITMRYLLPIYGTLIIFAAWALLRLWDAGTQAAADSQAASGKRWNVDYGLLTTTSRPAGRFGRSALKLLRYTLPLVLLLSAGWAYAFTRIYTQPNARVMAAQWLADHAPAGAYVMSEIWDDPLPLQATNASWGGTFEGISSAPYGEDDPRKWFGATNADGRYDEGMLDQLDRADYITITSNRIYDSTSRLRMRYPATMRYYHYLFSGELGFELAAEITSYPQILGIEIPDQAAEEAFTVYDHQRVLIFEKTPAYSRARAEQLITADVNWGEVYKSPVQIADRNATALRLTDSQWPRYAAAGDWMANRATSGFFAALAPLTWLLVLELLGLAMFALLFRLFPRLPDRGFSLAKILGLLLVAYTAWLLGSLGNGSGLPGSAGAPLQWPILPLPFSPATLWLCAAPLLILGAWAAYGARDELRAFWQVRRRAILSAEAIFLGFFLLGLLLRWLNPDLWHPARGGEKPMDFAFLNAVLRAPAFPPADPWHAGGYINYYYFGFVLVGALIQLTSVAPSIGYNLAVATIMALTALGAWGVIFNLLARRDSSGADLPGEQRALVAAALAPILMLLLGNMAQPLFYLSGYAGDQTNRPEWAFWDATRIVNGTVNEFPFFTFLFADLHAHMIVMPLSLAILGLAVAAARGAWREMPRLPSPPTPLPERERGVAPRRNLELPAQERGGNVLIARIVALLGLLGLLAGAIRTTNTWDYPTFVGLTAVVVVLVAYRVLRAGGWDGLRAAILALTPLTFILLGNLLFAPFTANFATESSGVELLREGGALGTLRQIFEADRTSVADLLRLHGHWLLLTALAGLLLLRRFAGTSATVATGATIGLLTLLGVVFDWAAPMLLIPLLLLGFVLLWAMRSLPLHRLAPTGFAVAAVGLLLMVEVLVVKGDVGRLNTVFKFGLHSWMLFALSVAATLPWLWQRSTQLAQPATLALRSAVVVILLAGLVYPLTATPARLADRWMADAPRTLDGNAYMASVTSERNGQAFSLNEDAAAITWLQNNTDGTPILLEAHLPSYQWAGRVAVNTGMPTILGWEWHQVQQRNAVNAGPVINQRQQVISQIFNTSDPIAALEHLRAYGVEYVYVGGVERATYDPNGLAKFELMAERGYLEPVFSQGQTTIYRVVEPGRPTQLTNDLPIVPPTADTIPALMLDLPVNELPAVNEYAWLGAPGQNSWIATLLWLVAIYGIGALGLPLAYAVFGSWRDGGAIFAKPIGFLLLGYAVWLPTSLGLQQYDLWGVFAAVLLLLIGNAALLWWIGREVSDQPAIQANLEHGLRRMVADLRERRRSILAGEIVFLLAFAALSLIRALNPDLWHPTWGGEKPMEFGFLNAILRSPVMPPYDPFFSGGYINYYYYGFYLFSLPIKLTGIAPAIGFNLAVATIFGLLLAGVYRLATQITARRRYGVVAALLVGVAGNLSAVFTTEWGWSSGIRGVLDAWSGGLAGFGERLGTWYIGPSRVIEYTINEFPFFTFIFADLHPHMIALPFGILAVALGYRVLSEPQSVRRVAPLLALTLGGLAVTNSWDFPTFALLSGLAFVGAGWRGANGSFRRAIGFGLLATATAFGGMLLYTSFFDRYYAMVGGVGSVPLTTGTPVYDYLIVFGPALAVVLPLVLGAIWRVWRGSPRRPILERPVWSWAIPALLVAALVAAILTPTLALRILLAALLLGLITVLARREVGNPAWYALTLAWVGLAVSLGFELLYIRDHLAGGDWFRMNTVFKFGMHAWVLLGLAAAIGLPALLNGLRRAAGQPGQAFGLALLAVVAVLASIYPLAGVPSRIGNRFDVETGPTLDGLAFMREAEFEYDCASFGGCGPGIERPIVDLSGDAAAIEWLNNSIEGTPIVVQSNLWFYRSYGIRVAANTGLPTVISSLHANEQRDPAITAVRDRDVEEFYGSSDIEDALRFLATYRVNYVYVGAVEHALYAPEALAKFEQMRGTYLNPVYDTPQVQIYQVLGIPSSYAGPEPYDFAADAPPQPPAELPSGEIPAGLVELEEEVQANPADAPLAFGLAERYRQIGRFDDAARVLERAAMANPNDVGLHHLWGDILSQAGRYDEAEQAYLGAIQAEPSAGNFNKLGAALLIWGRLDKAEIALSQAVQADPNVPEPYYRLGQLFVATGEESRAIAELERYLEIDPNGPYAEDARKLLGSLE